MIVPIYNREKYLETCLTSIIEQTYRNLEIILIDDGSTDASFAICEKYASKDKRIVLLKQANSGVSAARNAGLRCASGNYIGFVDSDDWLDIRAYEILVRNLENTNADVSVGGFSREYGEKKNHSAVEQPDGLIEYYKEKTLILDGLTDTEGVFNCFIWNKLYKKKILMGVYFNETIYMSEDFEFNWRIFKNVKRAVFTNYPVYHYRVFNNSLTRRCPTENFLSAIQTVEKILLEGMNYSDKIHQNIINDYLRLNIRAAETLLCNYDKDVYLKIKRNIYEHKDGVVILRADMKMLCKGLMVGFRVYALLYWIEKPVKLAIRKLKKVFII